MAVPGANQLQHGATVIPAFRARGPRRTALGLFEGWLPMSVCRHRGVACDRAARSAAQSFFLMALAYP